MKRKISLLLFALILGQDLMAQTQKELEAAFIFNFIRFTQFNLDKKEIAVCVFDDRNLHKTLTERLDGKELEAKTIKVHDSPKIENCDVIFLAQKKSLRSTQHKLVIAREKYENVTIILKNKDKKIVFNINKGLLEKSNISMSSKVLRLAKEVY